jgi:hypothetical protein
VPVRVTGSNPISDYVDPTKASVLDSDTQKAIRALAQWLPFGGDPGADAIGMVNPMMAAETELSPTVQKMAERVKNSPTTQAIAEKVNNFIKAYHGSPHNFEKFSTAHIGTGEGAQSYGHGLYFAENPAVAEEYKQALGDVVPSFNGKPATAGYEPVAYDILSEHSTSLDDALKMADQQSRAAGYDAAALRRTVTENFGKELGTAQTGKMYEVAIKADPEHFLDWDKPLADHPPEVLNRVRRVLDDRYGAGTGDQFVARGTDPRDLVANFDDLPTGGMERLLNQAGVPGVKYLDQFSRGAGKGTYNWTVFDDSKIDILKKLGVALPFIEGLRYKAKQNQGKVLQSDLNEAMASGSVRRNIGG